MNEEQIQDVVKWTESLEEQEVDHLLSEAQRRFDSDQQQFSALDSRIVAIVGWAIVGVGTLLLARSREFDFSGPGIVASVVIVGASLVVTAGTFALWPRSWASSLDLGIISDSAQVIWSLSCQCSVDIASGGRVEPSSLSGGVQILSL